MEVPGSTYLATNFLELLSILKNILVAHFIHRKFYRIKTFPNNVQKLGQVGK